MKINKSVEVNFLLQYLINSLKKYLFILQNMQNKQIKWSDQVNMGQMILKNRVCMAALTRQRCNPQTGVPNDLVAQYYAQRVGAGMVLTEAVAWTQRGQCFPGAACLWNQQHSQGWKKVIQKMHSNNSGTKVFLQIFHGGRACLTKTTRGFHPQAPSQIAIRDPHRRLGIPHEVPAAMTIQQIQQTKQAYRKSIVLAKQSNFDGIQLHAAHGYLIDEFIRSESNKRNDQYGGSVQKRCRFVLELIDITLQYFKPWQIGLKISPVSRINDQYDQNPSQTYIYLCQKLSQKKIGFLQIRQSTQVNFSKQPYPKTSLQQMPNICQILRPHFNGIMIANQGFNAVSGLQKMKKDNVQMISFGKLYISNPDLAQRLIQGKEVNNKWDLKTFYGPAQNLGTGYTDYPFYDDWKQQVQNS